MITNKEILQNQLEHTTIQQDQEWLQILQELQAAGVTKDEFKEYLERVRNEKESR